MFYKVLNGQLKDSKGVVFTSGKTLSVYNAGYCDKFFFSNKISSMLSDYTFDSDARVCEVEPVGEVEKWNGYFHSDQLMVVRELTREEIFQTLLEEKCALKTLLALYPP